MLGGRSIPSLLPRGTILILNDLQLRREGCDVYPEKCSIRKPYSDEAHEKAMTYSTSRVIYRSTSNVTSSKPMGIKV